MATPEEKKSLEVRLKNLEEKIESLHKALNPETTVTKEEFDTFVKVGKAVGAFDPDTSCGINECRKLIPRFPTGPIIISCRLCDTECSCGPCNEFRVGRRRLRDFESMGF